MSISRLERENLEAHVDLCAERYKQLDYRLRTIETKVENIHEDINKANTGMVKVIITSAGTIVASLLGLIATLIIKF
jgi:hypothetical protein